MIKLDDRIKIVDSLLILLSNMTIQGSHVELVGISCVLSLCFLDEVGGKRFVFTSTNPILGICQELGVSFVYFRLHLIIHVHRQHLHKTILSLCCVALRGIIVGSAQHALRLITIFGKFMLIMLFRQHHDTLKIVIIIPVAINHGKPLQEIFIHLTEFLHMKQCLLPICDSPIYIIAQIIKASHVERIKPIVLMRSALLFL